MKIFTGKKFKQILEEMKESSYQQGYNDGKGIGYKNGYKAGLHEGLTSDKQGVVINSNGMYVFKDDSMNTTINNKLN